MQAIRRHELTINRETSTGSAHEVLAAQHAGGGRALGLAQSAPLANVEVPPQRGAWLHADGDDGAVDVGQFAHLDAEPGADAGNWRPPKAGLVTCKAWPIFSRAA